MSIGGRIRAARKAAGLSQEELARRAGMSLKGMGDIERGDIADPHYSSLSKIASGLGVAVAELLEEPAPSKAALAPLSLEWALTTPEGGGPSQEEYERAIREVPLEAHDTLNALYRNMAAQPKEGPRAIGGGVGYGRSDFFRSRFHPLHEELRRRRPAWAVVTWRPEQGLREVRWLIPEEERPARREQLNERFGEDGYIEIVDSESEHVEVLVG